MNPFHYRATIDRLARLAAKPNPSYVRVGAACALANELSPANPRRDLIRQLLELANPFEHARHKLRDLYDRASASFSPPSGGRCHGVACPALDAGTEGGPLLQEEEPSEEEDDPL